MALSFSIFGAVHALGATVEPDRFVQQFSDTAISTLRNKDLDDESRRGKLQALLRQGFALDRIGKLALGQHWRSATAEDREAYGNLFERFVLTIYGRRLDAYSDQTIEVTGVSPVKRGAMVTSYIEGKGAPIRVDWRLLDTEQGWRVVDLVVEGVSMLFTQRNEFTAIIERDGGRLSSLIEHLRLVVDHSSSS